MNPAKIILGLVPFAVFGLSATWVPLGWAGLLGLVAAITCLLLDLRAGVKALAVVGVVTMAAFAAVGFLVAPSVQDVIGDYGRGLATLVLGVYILVTAPFAPFSAGYARETVPREAWHSPRFVSLNRRISAAWGATVLGMAVCHLLASAIDGSGVHVPLVNVALNWGVPILAILATVRSTKALVGDAQRSHAASAA
jgi:hypothetical protein